MLLFSFLLFLLWPENVYAYQPGLQAVRDQTIQVNLLTDELQFSILDNAWPQNVLISRITYHADESIWHDELLDLASIPTPSYVTLAQIKRLCWCLQQKQKFESVVIKLHPVGPKTVHMELFLHNAFIVRRIKCKGSLVGKDRYAQKYVLQSGDIFDLMRHQQSIKTITKALHDDGYLSASIDDHVMYDNQLRHVFVTLYLQHIRHFTVKSVKITFKNNQKAIKQNGLDEVLFKLIKHLKRQYITQQIVEEYTDKIEQILIEHGFYNIAVQPLIAQKAADQAQVEFIISTSIQKRFEFIGNTFFTTQELLDKLLVLDSSFMLIPPALLVEDLEQLYKDKGFTHVRVLFKEEAQAFRFIINEGSRIELAQIVIETTSGQTITQEVAAITDMISKLKYYDHDTIKTLHEEILSLYVKKGYWDVYIAQEKLEFIGGTQKNYEHRLRIIVELSQQRLLAHIDIPGYRHWLAEDIFNNDQPGERPFDPATIKDQRVWLLEKFQQQNQLAVEVKPAIEEIPEKPGYMNLTWNCQFPAHIPNGELRFGKTIITGTQITSPHAIIRQLPWQEGDLWSKAKIEQALVNLQELNIYESVSLTPYDNADHYTNEPSKKALQLKCIEKDPIEVMLRLGVMQVSKSFTHLTGLTYRIGGTCLWRNPLHQADILRLEGDLTRYTRTGSLTYMASGFARYPIKTSSRLFTFKVDQPVIYGLKRTLYTESHHGISFNIKKQFGRYQAVCEYGAEFVKISGVARKLAKAICFKPQFVDIYQPFIWLEPTIKYAYLDNPVDPRKGIYSLLTMRALIPTNKQNSSRIKLLYEQSIYYPLIGSIVGAAHVHVGHIFGAPFPVLLPAERFYLGGPISIRGYGPRLAPPLNQYKDTDDCSQDICAWVPVGGKSMAVGNIELRSRIYHNIGGVLFTDIGILSQNEWSTITVDSIIGSTGFGLRYTTPIGLLRFDIGWKWKKTFPQEQCYAWFLTFGHAF